MIDMIWCDRYEFDMIYGIYDLDGWVQDCSISSVLALEILQPCPKPSLYDVKIYDVYCIHYHTLYYDIGHGKDYE